ncbi:MAG: hypothetical protein J2P57_09625, partial [Acidimicrobiaceae bacterium]|nr:hypothetical protein [Acidimicrobiaceae bacterium]
MASERYVLLGLAHARAKWFDEVSRWATSATIPAEFVKCVSAEEVRSRLVSGRPYSVLIVDATLPGFDRDLVAAASTVQTPVFAVHDGRGPRWSPTDLGVAAVLDAGFDREQLLDALHQHARLIGRGDALPALLDGDDTPRWLGALVTVCGPGGTGASTVAIAAAQVLARDARYGRRVCLADLAIRADQAMLHDTVELGPGVQELVEAHRLARPSPDEVRATTFEVPQRGYRLLVGLRHPHHWSGLRPRAVEAAVEGLRRSFQAVVADVTGDVEGEAQGGSIDVEERNALARTAVLNADCVLAVGSPGVKGVHSLALLLRLLTTAGVAPSRILPVVNRAPRSPRGRAEISRTLAALAGA